MGSRRRVTQFTAVRSLPWPLGFAVGVGAFFVIRGSVPWLMLPQSGPIAQVFNQGISEAFALTASMLSAIFCLAALASLFGSYQPRELQDTRNTLNSLSAKVWSRFELLLGEVTRPQGYVVAKTGLASADSRANLVWYEDGRRIVQCNSFNSNFFPIPP